MILNAQTPNITYGDAFACQTKYCITWVTKDSCRLVISTGVKFFKSPMVKSIIKSQSMKSLSDGAMDLMAIIRTEVDPSFLKPVKAEAEKPKEKKKKQKLTETEKSIRYVKYLITSTFGTFTTRRLIISLAISTAFSLFLYLAKRNSWFDSTGENARILEEKRHSCFNLWKLGTNEWTSELGLGFKNDFYQQRYLLDYDFANMAVWASFYMITILLHERRSTRP